jgi:hypothetical protein
MANTPLGLLIGRLRRDVLLSQAALLDARRTRPPGEPRTPERLAQSSEDLGYLKSLKD